MELAPKIDEIADKISYSESKKRELADFIRNIGSGFNLFSDVGSTDNLRVAGVDGGIVKRSLHGFDFILARAIGVYFEYINGKIGKVNYYPSKTVSPDLVFLENANDMDYSYSSAITRQTLEIDCTLKTAKKFNPEIMLMDGSIVPHYSDRPGSDSSVYRSYLNLLDLCDSLFRYCKQNNILLAGVVEDSRGSSFCNLVKKDVFPNIKHDPEMLKILENSRDTGLLFWILKQGQKTKTFPYSEKPEEHPVLRDLKGYEINSFYLKTAEYDRPIRVDFLGDQSDEIASKIYSISSQNPGYGIPSVIIEADQAAKLSEDEINSVVEDISSKSGGPGMLDLRRDSRPF